MTRLFVNLKGQGRQAIKRQHLGVTEWPPVAVPSKMTTEPAPRGSQSLSHPPLPNRHPSSNRGCDVEGVGWDSINFAIGIYQVIKVATFFQRSRHTHTHTRLLCQCQRRAECAAIYPLTAVEVVQTLYVCMAWTWDAVWKVPQCICMVWTLTPQKISANSPKSVTMSMVVAMCPSTTGKCADVEYTLESSILDHSLVAWLSHLHHLRFQPTLTIWGNMCGGNSAIVHPYAHPQQLKALKHYIY